MRKILKSIALSLAVFASITYVVYAAVSYPSTQTVNRIDAYQGVIDDGDQLYIVTFSLSSVNGTTLGADETFLFRLSDNGTYIQNTAPVAFSNSGYDDGVTAFYFTADDADLPAWQTANLSIHLVGNPALAWEGGSPPDISSSTIEAYNEGNTTIAARIRVIATQLESAYSLDMIELISGELKLTSTGATYFEQAIPNLRVIAPDVFSNLSSTPVFDETTYNQTQKTSQESRWIGDAYFDLTTVAAALNISRMWLTSTLYILFCFIITGIVVAKLQSIRPAAIIFAIAMAVGVFAGFLTTEAGVFGGVIAALGLVYSLFYRGAS